MNWFKKVLRSNRFTAAPLELYFLYKFFLKPKGWFESKYHRMPVDANHNPIPWLTYSAIHFLGQRVRNGVLEVFEFGSGHSTLWLAPRVKNIVSVEYDLVYFEEISNKLKKVDNVTYIHAQPGRNYYQQILAYNKAFDVVIIDGRERVLCAQNCLPALKNSGVIIFDNSERERYREGIDFLKAAGFKYIDFHGLTPGGVRSTQTTIFYREGNCMGI